VGVRKGDKEWLDFINSALAIIAQSGESEKLLDRWFGEEAKVLLRSLKK
jgi:ABC-type amino acid transport substrate-binding protein